MKKILILLLVVLTAGSAYGQRHDARVRKGGHRKEQMHGTRDRHHNRPTYDARGRNRTPVRREVACVEEWQYLWNGCHVRLLLDQIYVYDDRDDRIVGGDEVYLLPNGNYKVLKGGFWRIYDRKGDMTFISGDEIRYWHPGYYAVRSAGSWHVCDSKGDRIFGVWGDSVELMGNGIFRCSRGGHYYYYDSEGNQRM